jgi:hypothetical protein
MIPMSRGFVLSILLVVFVAAPWVDRMGSVANVLGSFRAPGPSARAGEPMAPPARLAAQKPRKRPARKSPAAHTDYQVPAGAVFSVRLKTSARSASSTTGDQVDAVLTETVFQDEVELIPAGSLVHGTVVDALPASPLALRGRIAVAFYVLEHAVTGSRAAIKTRPFAIDAPPPTGKRPVDAELLAGQQLNVVLTEPLLVRIPK